MRRSFYEGAFNRIFQEGKTMNIAVIGCGLIGRKRALALDVDDALTACCDVKNKNDE
jgi:hypothetical protein